MAGAIAELARKPWSAISATSIHIGPHLLMEAGPRVLPTFPETLSQSAEIQLRKLGVEIITGDPVIQCDKSGVSLEERQDNRNGHHHVGRRRHGFSGGEMAEGRRG